MVLADKARTAHHISHYLSSADRKEILHDLGEVAYILLDYYMQQANFGNANFDDERVAKALGYTPQKVRKNRYKLTKAGWFLQVTYSHRKYRPILLTLLGQQTVATYTQDPEEIFSIIFADHPYSKSN